MDVIEVDYDETYMKSRYHIVWRAEVLCPIIHAQFLPTTIVEVGCAIGEFVKWFNKEGIPAIGIDNSIAAQQLFVGNPDWFILADPAQELLAIPEAPFDLCLCFDVGSVLPREEQRYFFQKNLTALSSRILFSVKDAWKQEWRQRFLDEGYTEDTKVVVEIRKQLDTWKTKSAMKAIYNGLMFFERG